MTTYPAEGAARRSVQASLGAKLAEVSGLVDVLNVEIFKLAERAENAEDALERLHARIHRDFNFDASESAAPDDERWARVMDDLVTFADSVYLPIADGAA